MIKPNKIFIELTNVCNFNCTFCPNEAMTRDKGFMETDIAKRLITEIYKNKISSEVCFFVMGEPLLHPNWFDIFSFASEKGLITRVSTNGSMFNDKNIKRVYEVGLDILQISFQTPTKESFKHRRTKFITHKRYVKRIKNVIEEKYRVGSKTNIQLLMMNDKRKLFIKDKILYRDILNEWISFAEKISKRKSIPLLFNKNDLNKKIPLSFDFNLQIEVLPGFIIVISSPHNWKNNMATTNIQRARIGSCNALDDQFAILWNGNYVLCCSDFDGKTTIGNAHNQTLTEILTSEKSKKIRKGFRKCSLPFEYCKICRGGESSITSLTNQLSSCIIYNLPGYRNLRGFVTRKIEGS